MAFAIIPITNPAGRTRTDTASARDISVIDQRCTDRRKNARLVDINRNYDVSWGLDTGSSDESYMDDYRGPSPMSEVEARTVAKLAEDWAPDMCRPAAHRHASAAYLDGASPPHAGTLICIRARSPCTHHGTGRAITLRTRSAPPT